LHSSSCISIPIRPVNGSPGRSNPTCRPSTSEPATSVGVPTLLDGSRQAMAPRQARVLADHRVCRFDARHHAPPLGSLRLRPLPVSTLARFVRNHPFLDSVSLAAESTGGLRDAGGRRQDGSTGGESRDAGRRKRLRHSFPHRLLRPGSLGSPVGLGPITTHRKGHGRLVRAARICW
jgi:hypothetical protein